MTTLDQQISIMKIEDQRAKLERLKAAYERADDRVLAAEVAVQRAREAKGRAVAAYTVASERLWVMEHPGED